MKLHFTKSKRREKHVSNKKFIEKYQISKSRGVFVLPHALLIRRHDFIQNIKHPSNKSPRRWHRGISQRFYQEIDFTHLQPWKLQVKACKWNNEYIKARFIESMRIVVSNSSCDHNAGFMKAGKQNSSSITKRLASSNLVMSWSRCAKENIFLSKNIPVWKPRIGFFETTAETFLRSSRL